MVKRPIETRLENGAVIITDRMEGVRSATLGFFYRVGSRDEPVELNGITHFIEHAVFKGTDKRSARDIAVEQDRLGGSLEAFTTHEETGFAIKVKDDQVEPAFELLADLLTHPRFDDRELRSERRVVLEELKMVEDSSDEYLTDLFLAAYFPHHPLGMNIAGTRSTVRSFDRSKTEDYFHRAFAPAELVVAAAGNIDHKQIVRLAKRTIGELPRRRKIGQRGRRPAPAAPVFIKQKRNLEQAHVVLATPFPAGRDRSRYAADLLANILGGGMSSRLWQEIRESRGLAYSVGASPVMFRDTGYFSIFAAASAGHVGEITDVAIAELRRVVKDGVTPEELELVKQQAVTNVLLSLEDSAARAAGAAQCELLFGRQIPVEETIANIEAVSLADIRSLARRYFRSERVAFAALGDLRTLKVPRSRLSI